MRLCESQLRETIKEYVEDGMSNNKICKTLRIHHVQLREIKAEVSPSLDSRGDVTKFAARYKEYYREL